MLEFVSNVVHNAVKNTSAFDVFMSVGIGASSFLTLSQLGAARFGIMPLILTQSSRQSMGLSTQGSLHAWNFFFSKAATPVVASVVLSSISYLAASTQLPQQKRGDTTADDIKKMLYLTSFIAITPLPFTAIRLLPRIKTLQGFLPKATLIGADEALVMSNIKSWNAGHGIRVILYASSLVMGLLTYSGAPRA